MPDAAMEPPGAFFLHYRYALEFEIESDPWHREPHGGEQRLRYSPRRSGKPAESDGDKNRTVFLDREFFNDFIMASRLDKRIKRKVRFFPGIPPSCTPLYTGRKPIYSDNLPTNGLPSTHNALHPAEFLSYAYYERPLRLRCFQSHTISRTGQ